MRTVRREDRHIVVEGGIAKEDGQIWKKGRWEETYLSS